MKKGLFLLLGLVLFCTGCSTAKPESSVPAYFAPIAQELEDSWEGMTAIEPEFNVLSFWYDRGLAWTGKVEGNTYQSYWDGEYFSYDLENELADMGEWREVLGVFQIDEGGKRYVCLSCYDMVEKQPNNWSFENDGLFLLEISAPPSEECVVTAYRHPQISLLNQFCYRLGNSLYMISDNLLVIHLDSKELSYCEEEYETVKAYAVEQFHEDVPIYCFRAIYEEDDVTVYSGVISNDEHGFTTRGMVFVAFRDGKPIARMCADFTAGGSTEGIEIEQL